MWVDKLSTLSKWVAEILRVNDEKFNLYRASRVLY